MKNHGYDFEKLKKEPVFTRFSFHPFDLGWLAILLPLVITGITLKLIRIMRFGHLDSLSGLWEVFRLDIFLYLCLLFIGWAITGMSKKPLVRFLSFLGLQVVAAFLIVLEFVAHNYYLKTGSLMNFALLKHSFEHYQQISKVAQSEAGIYTLTGMLLATLAAVILPWTASIWIYLKRKSYFHTKLKELPLLSRYAFLFFAFCIYLFFLKPGHSSEQAVFSRNFSYEVAWSLFADRELENSPPPDSQFKPPIDSHLIRSRFTKKRNLVVIVLESTRADATSIYNPKLDTTPFLKQLAKNSIVALRGYSVNPHTSKCLVAIHCGIEPRPGMAVHEAGRGGLPAKCLPSLLKEVGYHTAYFQSPTYWFESRHKLVKNLKYDEFYPGESHPKQGFSKVNYFGYEDKIMLAPAEKWLKEYKQKNGNKPFLLTFLTNTSHHPYGVPKGWPIKQYVTNPRFNRYLNTVAYVDSFLKDLFDIFKRTRYYENTVFLITGDHGEAFYEHGFRGHSNHLYEETLRIPVLIHDPLRKTNLRIRKVVAEYDYLPTIIPFLGYQIENNHYRGINFMRIQKSPRNVYLSCWKNYTCLGFVNKFEKYIYWFNNRPDEYYHLQADPLEKKNLARETHNIAMYRQQTLTWYKQIKALYDQMGVRP